MLKVTRGSQTKIIIVLKSERENSRIHLNSEGWKSSLTKCLSTPFGNTQLLFGTIMTCSWQRLSVYTEGIQGLKYSYVAFPGPKKA